MDAPQLTQACRAVVRRLVLVHWSALVTRTACWTFGVLTAAIGLWALVTFKAPGLAAPLGIVGIWLALTAAWAWLRRPSAARGLAIWDGRSARNEMFLSAYCFEQTAAPTPGEQLHLACARRQLPGELVKLKTQLPTEWKHRAWLAPLAFVLLLQLAGSRPSAPPAPTIATDTRERAAELAGALDEKTQSLDPLPGLDEAERKQVEDLKQSVHEAAEALKDLADATPRQALGELEERARAAEKLAETLGDADSAKMSTAMLDEMDRHADLSDLSAALRAEDAQRTAAEATRLADKLAEEKLSLDERKRIAEAFKKSLAAANEKDRQTNAGQHLAGADRELQNKRPDRASKQMRELAQSMSRRGQRKQSAQQLQQLARNLRRAGQQIFGRKNDGLQRLAQNQNGANQPGLQRAGTPRPIALAQLMPGQPPAGQQNRGQPSGGQPAGAPPAGAPQSPGQQSPGQQPSAPVPGQAAGQPIGAGQPGAPMTTVPVPGTGNPNPAQSAQAGSPQAAASSAQPGAGGPAPVPGTQPGGQSPGAGQSPGTGQTAGSGQSPGAGQAPGAGGAAAPGAAAGAQGQGQLGGLQAGVGSAPMGNNPTIPLAAARQGIVQAQVGKDGASQARQINPREHSEQAQRDARQTAADFIKVQEEALADEPLPAARREQVRRYFNSLRQHLSTSDTPSETKHDDRDADSR